MDQYKAVKHPLSTEKGIKLMEAENKLIFVVDRAATKTDVKKAVEELFKVKVQSVKTIITKRKKRAYVKLTQDSPAIETATQLGLM